MRCYLLVWEVLLVDFAGLTVVVLLGGAGAFLNEAFFYKCGCWFFLVVFVRGVLIASLVILDIQVGAMEVSAKSNR